LLAALLAGVAAAKPRADFTLDDALAYPFVDNLVAAERADAIAWVVNVRGVRNIWYAAGPGFTPRQITHYAADDGQELSNLIISPDGARLVYVRGGDHDANWPAEGNLAPDPSSSPDQPQVTIWSASLAGAAPVKLAEGDAPAISARGQLAYVKDRVVWTTQLDGKGKPERLFFDRGKDADLTFSPDGSALAFVSSRGDHAFIGIYLGKDRPLAYLAPSTGRDEEPRWSPDGKSVAFTRRPGEGGPPEPLLTEVGHPWSIWVADVASGHGHAVWRSPQTQQGSWPEVEGEANLAWGADGRLVFLAESDGWPHLYAIAAAGGPARLLTAGAYMVEHEAMSRDKATVIFDANTGAARDDDDRRHVFAVSVDGGAPRPLTAGEGLEWAPVAAARGQVAFVDASVGVPPAVALVDLQGARRDVSPAASYAPGADFVTPRNVAWKAPDGLIVHGQLFQREGGAPKPGVIFVHGGPPRQMLLGWHYMDYYSNAYAVNQYLAAHGFVVLSVNYRLGIGYGRAFQHPAHAGPAGAAEYQDVLSGARLLQRESGVNPARIGIWGGSYGGYLTALALARNSDVFKAGVDMHGVHDWSIYVGRESGHHPDARAEEGDFPAAMKTSFAASPDADIATWTSPVMLIQGDDDRNVDFHQTVDLARRLDARGVAYEELVIPNEIHGFLRHESWLAADTATVDFLRRKLGGSGD
jgi:dipeptidyl aminopeptidase/acylaminoacyl peptidase